MEQRSLWAFTVKVPTQKAKIQEEVYSGIPTWNLIWNGRVHHTWENLRSIMIWLRNNRYGVSLQLSKICQSVIRHPENDSLLSQTWRSNTQSFLLKLISSKNICDYGLKIWCAEI